jgi:N-methylhydantoinase B
MCYIDSVELAELYQPVLIRKRAFVRDTEGAGTYRGAPSTVVEFGPVSGTFEIGYCSDGNINGPQGVRGGRAGGTSNQWVEEPGGKRRPLAAFGMQHIGEQEMLVAISTGGGGYGDPRVRDVDLVAEDVQEKWITAERARAVYGVALDASGRVDRAATQTLRA